MSRLVKKMATTGTRDFKPKTYPSNAKVFMYAYFRGINYLVDEYGHELDECEGDDERMGHIVIHTLSVAFDVDLDIVLKDYYSLKRLKEAEKAKVLTI